MANPSREPRALAFRDSRQGRLQPDATKSKAGVELETTACPLCGSTKNTPQRKVADRFNLASGPVFQLVRCDACAFVFLNPRPAAETISAFYEHEAYQPFLSTRASLAVWDWLYTLVRRYTLPAKRRKIERMKASGSLLDVGCGTGEFLHEMKKHGWQVAGTEQDAHAARFAQEEYGLQVATCDLAACDFQSGSFDVVTLWHVLEHVHEPGALLQRVADLLREDGVILAAMPNIASWDAGYYGANWVPLDAPRHLTHFTPQSVTRLCEQLDLRLVRSQQMVADAFYNCLMSERLIAAANRSAKGMTLLQYVRAFGIAKFSILVASGVLQRKKRSGSSVLYTIKKRSNYDE
ncbi:MAG: class I SAM-dependent methyltransferase [bacterium]